MVIGIRKLYADSREKCCGVPKYFPELTGKIFVAFLGSSQVSQKEITSTLTKESSGKWCPWEVPTEPTGKIYLVSLGKFPLAPI